MPAPSVLGAAGPLPPPGHTGSHVVNPNKAETPDDGPADPAPRRPPEPDAADCCGEGCVRCVYDVYEDALERYRRALEAWRTRHPPA